MTGAVAGQETPGSTANEFNMLAFVIEGFLSRLNTVKLCRVVSCSNTGGLSPVGTVTLQPLVNQMSGLGQPTPHGELYEVPYFRLQGGANAIILDPQPGDIGMAAFCDRDISGVKANPQGAVASGGVNPNGFSILDWADGLYLGGFLNGVPTQYIAFASGGISVFSPTKITLTAPVVDIEATTSATINSPVVDIEATTSATLTAPVIDIEATISAKLTAPVVDIEATTSITVNSPANTIEGAGTSIDGRPFLLHEHVNGGGVGNSGGVA